MQVKSDYRTAMESREQAGSKTGLLHVPPGLETDAGARRPAGLSLLQRLGRKHARPAAPPAVYARRRLCTGMSPCWASAPGNSPVTLVNLGYLRV